MIHLIFVIFVLFFTFEIHDCLDWDQPITSRIKCPIRKSFVLFAISPDCNLDCFGNLLLSFIIIEEESRIPPDIPGVDMNSTWNTVIRFGSNFTVEIGPNDNVSEALSCTNVS